MNFVGLSIVQSVGPRKTENTRVEIICLREGYSCMRMAGVSHACEWPLKTPRNLFIYRFQGIINANVVSELAAQTGNFYELSAARFHFFR